MMENRKNTVRVYVVADSAPARQKLLGMLDGIPAAELVGVASKALPAAAGLARLQPDVLLLDVEVEKNADSALMSYITRRLPECKVIVLPATPEGRRPKSSKLLQNAERRRKEGISEHESRGSLRRTIEQFLEEKARREAQGMRPLRSASVHGMPAYTVHGPGDHATIGARAGTERRRKHAERRKAEIHRMETASRFQSLIEQLPGIPYIASLDKDGSNIYVSPKIKDLLGFTSEQWCGDPSLRLRQIHPDDQASVRQAITDAIATNSAYSIDYRIFGGDGTLHWLHDEARVMSDDDGTPLLLQGAALDITERKRAQEELERSHCELQELITALDMLRIEEQRRLAQEMHDDFGQLLAAMKMDLSTLRQHLPPGNSQVVKYLGSINELVDTMVTSVRRIIADLPPKILEDLGLFHALESMIVNFEKRHRISCRLHLPTGEPMLDTRIRTALYRMVQEILNNVAKHAQASCVTARIDRDDEHGTITLTIADNGIGMSADMRHKPGSFGLVGMRERVASLRGEMSMDSKPGEGTTVRIVIPARCDSPPHEN